MLDKDKLVFESHEKYLRRLDGDLIGRSYRLAMDNGEEYDVRFITGDVLEWRSAESALKWEKYGCLRSDDTTFYVTSELSGTEYRTLITLVIDEENDLVTMAVSRQGVYPRRPRLVLVDYIFGAIRRQDKPLPLKRHSFTRELVGKKLTWYYADGFINTHMYLDEVYYRIRPLATVETDDPTASGEATKEMLYDEPARFIKIKEGVYLIGFVEANMNYVDSMKGGNNLMILVNLNTGSDCGRTFCLNKQQKEEHGMFRAYGEAWEEDIPMEHVPSPYRV